MLMDFDRFTTAAKLAYRRCGGSAYTLEEVLQVFRYYFETYEMVFDAEHPMISIQQIARIIEKMPYIHEDDGHEFSMNDIAPKDYEAMIDQHFVTKYRGCDYNINHFFSGQIRDMRYYETCYC